MSKKYALRSISYPYDNHYITTKTDSVCIVEYYDTQSEAEKELKSRLVNTYYNYKKTEAFFAFDVFDGWASEEILEKACQFYTKKTGTDLSEVGDVYELDLTNVLELELSDDEIVELMILLGINEYDIIEVDAEKTFYAVWINRKEKYFGQVYGQSVIPFENDYLDFDGDELLEHFVSVLKGCCPKGELSDLSDNPDALLSFIDRVDYLHYDQSSEDKSIYIDLNDYYYGRYDNMEDLIQLNGLLQTPWFEIRTLNISKLQQINNEFKEKNKNLLSAQECFHKAKMLLDYINDNNDEFYNDQLKAIDCYQQGIAYAKKALQTDEEPDEVKKQIGNALYQLAKLADSTADTVLEKSDDYENKADFYNEYLLVIMKHWQQAIDAYQQIMEIDDIDYFPHNLNTLIITYSEYNLFLLDRYLREEFKNKDACLEIFYLWLSELSDLLATSRSKLVGDKSTDFLKQDDAILLFENKFNLPLVTVLHHVLRNGALDAGVYADKIKATNPQKAGEFYDIAKKGLYQALLIEPTAGTALSILSMFVRHYHADTQLFAEQLNNAKAKFEALVKEYPNFMGDMAFNRACIAALENDVKTAIDYLKISHEEGYSSLKESVKNDSDFNGLLNVVEFKAFLDSIE